MAIRPGAVLLLAALALCRGEAAAGEAYPPEIEAVFRRVAEILQIAIRDEIPRPRIRIGPEVDPAELSRALGVDTGGRIINAYLPETNTIVLRQWSVPSLAHELVHYFQVMYWRLDPREGDGRDTAERQATAVERMFREGPARAPVGP